MSGFCQLWLTCKNQAEADRVVSVLLDKRLITCAKQINISSDAHWRGKIEHAQEIMLLMDSREDLFDEAESEIAKIHSYDTFVLQTTPILKVSKKAKDWLNENLKS